MNCPVRPGYAKILFTDLNYGEPDPYTQPRGRWSLSALNSKRFLIHLLAPSAIFVIANAACKFPFDADGDAGPGL